MSAYGRPWTDPRDGKCWLVRTHPAKEAPDDPRPRTRPIKVRLRSMIRFRADTATNAEEEFQTENPAGKVAYAMLDSELQRLLDEAREGRDA